MTISPRFPEVLDHKSLVTDQAGIITPDWYGQFQGFHDWALAIEAALAETAANGNQYNNFIVNPSGLHKQRYEISAPTDDTYDFDAWYVLTQTAAVGSSLVTDAENGTPHMMRSTQTQASAQRHGRAHIILADDCKHLRGSDVTLTARVRISESTNIRYLVAEWTSTADAVTSDVVGTWTSTNYTFGSGTFFANTGSYTILATGPIALVANTLTDLTVNATVSSSANNLVVFFWTEGTQAQNGTFDIAKVRLLKGTTVPTLYVPRAKAAELTLCLYRFERLNMNMVGSELAIICPMTAYGDSGSGATVYKGRHGFTPKRTSEWTLELTAPDPSFTNHYHLLNNVGAPIVPNTVADDAHHTVVSGWLSVTSNAAALANADSTWFVCDDGANNKFDINADL